MLISLAEYRKMIGPALLPLRRYIRRQSHGQAISRWLTSSGVDVQLLITKTPSIYQTSLERQRQLTKASMELLQNNLTLRCQLIWLAGIETFPDAPNTYHSHILVGS